MNNTKIFKNAIIKLCTININLLCIVSNYINLGTRALWLAIFNTPFGRIPVLREYFGLGFIIIVLMNLFSFFYFVFDFISINFFTQEVFYFENIYNNEPNSPRMKPFNDPFGGRRPVHHPDRPPMKLPPRPEVPPFDWAAFWKDVRAFFTTSFTYEHFTKLVGTILDNIEDALSNDTKPINDLEEEWSDTWRMYYISIIQDHHSSAAVIRQAKLDLEAQIFNEKFIFANRTYVELTFMLMIGIYGWLYFGDNSTIPVWSVVDFCWEVYVRIYFKRMGVFIPANIPH